MKSTPLIGLRPHLCGCLFVILALAVSALRADQKPEAPPAAVQDMLKAHEFRSELVADLLAGRDKPQAVLGKLRGRSNAMGLRFESQADFALAAMDIGHRLIAAGKPEEAELFFIEAEKSLGQAIDKLSNDDAKTKAMLLEQRAFIRTEFLNKSPEADADLEKAAALQPEEKRLQRKRDLLPAGKTGRKDDKQSRDN